MVRTFIFLKFHHETLGWKREYGILILLKIDEDLGGAIKALSLCSCEIDASKGTLRVPGRIMEDFLQNGH